MPPRPDKLFKKFDATRKLRDKDFKALCYAPFVQLSFSPNGNASACCISRSYSLGNLREQRLMDIWKGGRAQAFRKALERYEFPPGCEWCKWSLEGGNLRDHEILRFDAYPVRARDSWPTQLEFALSNTCNLACTMCDGDYSSVIRAKEGLPPLVPAYGDQFFDDLRDFLPHLRAAAFLGGEPFLQDECHRIWDMMIDGGLHPDCNVTTNGSTYNERVERILHSLPVNLSISIDGVRPETIESVRINVKYDKLMANLERFNAYVQGTSDPYSSQRNHSMQMNFCVMQQNWRELPDFFVFAEGLGASVWSALVIQPDHCSLFTLPAEELAESIDWLDGHTRSLKKQLTRNRTKWLELMTELRGHLTESKDRLDGVKSSREANKAATSEQKSPIHRAWKLMREGDHAGALAAATSVVATDPLFYKARVLVGEILTYDGDLDGAEQTLQQAIELAPRHPEALMRLAWLRLHQGRHADGIEIVESARKASAKLRSVESFIEEDLMLVEAYLCHGAGQSERALASVDHFLLRSPAHTDATSLKRQILAAG